MRNINYISTRGNTQPVTSAQAIKQGLADDGGLFMPAEIPALTASDFDFLKKATYPERAAYIMAKNAVVGLAKSLAVDYAPNGVTVNCISPSMIETKFLAETSHLIVEQAAQAHPMKRNATVKDVVPAMAFLLSDEAAYITGVNLPITGGSVIE